MALNAKTLIERNHLFRGLPQKTIDRVAALATRRIYDEGAIIFMRGDPGDSLCGVVTGRVRISASRAGGKEVFLNIMEPGDAFGEIALLDGSPRTATATAMARTELMIIARDAFFALLRTEPQLAEHLIQLLCKRVRWTAEQMEDSALLNVPAKIAKRLLSLASVHGRESPEGTRLVISQEELAQFLGLSRQVVNQHLQSWRAQGWIALGRGNVTIANPRAMQKVTQQA
ncbi:MAG TPA: Crp/Fnr family transcriptional regulator [Steroidobacteraceae bacterium]|nr:Crp/Fnr family transcriptional regulator [Steroidobacteraceae bacterium]